MRKILFLTTQFPYPIDNGGKIGAFNGLSVISKNNKVVVVSFSEDSSGYLEGKKYFEKILPNVTFLEPARQDVHIRKKPFKLASAIVRAMIKNVPYAISKFENAAMIKKIDRVIESEHWNLVFVDYINMCGYGRYIRKRYRECFDYYIFKDHNKEYELVEQEAQKYSGIKKKILELDSQRTLMCEKQEAREADIVYSVCDDNTRFLKAFNCNAHSMLPTYKIKENKTQNREFRNTYKVFFLGGLSWKANLDGLEWFVNDVFPIIKSNVPQASLTIIGGGLNYNPFEGKNGVEYLGYMKDISGVYEDKMVFIVPLFEGSGIRIKILEAFDNEVPVVSTSIGCGTIGAIDGEQLIVADDKDEFAKGVIKLLQDEKLNKEIRKNAKEFLQNKYSLTKRQEEFENEIQKLYRKKVSIILVNYKNYKDTIKCLDSLKKVMYQNLSIIVVDNNSKDDSFEILKEYEDDRIIVMESGFNGGFAFGNNFGIRKALENDSDYVLLLNNDTVVDSDFLMPLLQVAENDKHVGIVTSRIMFYPDTDRIWYAGGKVDWNNLRAIHCGLGEKISEKFSQKSTVDFASGCCMLIPKNTIKEVGLLPEEYFMYYEDMDYCIMVADKGLKIEYVPESVIYHCVSSSSGGDGSPFTVEWQARARRIFWKKYAQRFSIIKKIYIPIKCDCRTVVKCLIGKNKIGKVRAFVRSYRSN